MTLYQQKTMPFEAIQWTLDNYQEVIAFTNGSVALTADDQCVIVNGETVCENDWIIKVTGSSNIIKLGICSNSMFQQNYEQYQGLQ